MKLLAMQKSNGSFKLSSSTLVQRLWWGEKISGTGGRTKSIVIFRMLLLALLCDNNTTSLVQCNFAGTFQFGI